MITRPSMTTTRRLGVMLCILVLWASPAAAHPFSDASVQSLVVGFYADSCPQLEDIVYQGMQDAVQREARLAASILRLLFHDCFVQGCDASLLLDDTSTFQGEKTAGPNNNSVRGFEVLDAIKQSVEEACPNTVSCADILALASRDGVSLLNGPTWDVPLGRRDAKTASLKGANTNIPAPNSTISTLVSKFAAQGLSAKDMVVLSGAHTIGKARCVSFRQRLYNPNENGQSNPTFESKSFQQKLVEVCPQVGGDNNLSPLDFVSPSSFDTQYFGNLVMGNGLLASDQILASFSSPYITSLTYALSRSTLDFFEEFKKSMVTMSSINVLTGSQGEIRKNCRKVNS